MKKIFIVFLIIFFSFMIIGCDRYDDDPGSGNSGNNGDTADNDNIGDLIIINNPQRKIYYTVNANLYTEDLSQTLNNIYNNIENDEWLDRQTVYEKSATLVIRVKTTRLNSFLEILKNNGNITDLTQVATDVSLNYQNTANKIVALNEERARLVELYPQATISDMIEINKRISEVDLKLGELQGTINQYDSLIEYSVIELKVREQTNIEYTYWEKIGNVFSGGWNVFVLIISYVFLMIVTLLPFAALSIPILILIKHINKKSKIKKIEQQKRQT